MAGGSGSGSNTTTQVQQIPAFEQQSSQNNQALAQSLGSQPYPQYQGALIQPNNATQTQGQQTAVAAGTNWQPQFTDAQGATANALNSNGFNQFLGQANSQIGTSLDPSGFNAYEGQAGNQIGQGVNATGFNNYENQASNQIGQGLNASGFNAYENQAGNASTVQGAQQAQAGATQNAQNLASNPNAVSAYMNPFIQQALAPQISDLNLQLNQEQQGINSQAAQAGAFGDARQGAAQGTQNYYGNQALNQLIGTGYNNAYTQALSALGQAQNTQLGAASQYGNIAQSGLGEQSQQAQLAAQQQAEQGIQLQGAQQYGNLAGQQQNEQGLQLQGAQQYANLAGQQQAEQQIGLQGAQQYAGLANAQLGQQQLQLQGGNQEAALANQQQQQTLAGANAEYNAGTQQQTQQQNELNAAYQQYLNQVNWPYQMLNVQESALSNSPYNIATATTLPSANSTAQGFGLLAGASGLLGGLAGGGSSTSPFGGQAIQQ